MIPLFVFLALWGIAILLFGIMTLITQAMSLRFCISGFAAVASNVIFISVVLFVIGATILYLLGVDWSQTISVMPAGLPGIAP